MARLKYYNQAINIKPDNAYYYTGRGLTKRELGDRAGAIDDFTEAIKLKT